MDWAALMKHLRGFTSEKRHKAHSLRHATKDPMRKAGVDKVSQDIILGHAPANIGETYGAKKDFLQWLFAGFEKSKQINPSPPYTLNLQEVETQQLRNATVGRKILIKTIWLPMTQ